MSIKCGYCKTQFSTREALQEHLETCSKEVIQVATGTPPLDPKPSTSGKVYECGNCGASFTRKESLIMHRANCP